MNNYILINDYLLSIPKYQINSNDECFLNYKLLNEDIDSINKDLIKSLLQNQLCKDTFFDKIDDVMVFNQNKLIDVIFNQNEYLDGSLTKYNNKIGLFLKDIDTIQLNFPYKDCILVGGMDKEDDKINSEIFYNETIDKNKINKLFEPKIFHNIKKFSFDETLKEDNNLENPNNIQIDTNINEIQFETITDDNGNEKNILKDNLLIKGNNLLGLHSLAKRLSNSIDVIYIDPPYYFNEIKSADTFAYNSNFKLSTWLTFMKNRLEIAKELLSDEGFIFISIDEDGQDYLKLLCDETFGSNNFLGNIVWDKRNPKGNVKHLSLLTEDILLYSKNKNNINTVNKLLIKKNGLEFLYKKKDTLFKQYKENKKSLKEINKEFSVFISKLEIKEGLKAYKFIDINGKIYRGVSLSAPGSKQFYNILHPTTNKPCKTESRGWGFKESELKKLIEQNLILFGEDENIIPNKIQFLEDYEKEIMTNLFSYAGSGMSDLEHVEMNKYLFQNPKPIKLISFLLEHTKQNAIILDFFAGSGTTGHTIMDLNKKDNGNRKFILLEQMDYIESITSERLKRSMIKENYNNSFVYMEMMESETKLLRNQIKSVNSIDNLNLLIDIYFDSGYFININDKQDLLDKLDSIYSKKQDLNLVLKTLIEKYMENNIDYNSFEDMEEHKSNLKENEYQLNKSFYGDSK